MQKGRIIFHIDMNAFFASCEIKRRPELKNKAVVVARNDEQRRAIILSPNYIARDKGIKTTMSVKEAMKIDPYIVVVEPDHAYYSEISKTFMKFLYLITDQVEQGSIDEAYLDVTETVKKVENPLMLAQYIQTTLYEKFDLPCSIGIGPNKFLAKMASNYKKPLGITIFRKREIEKTIWPMDVGKMYGVGPKTKAKLNSIGVKTIKDLATYPDYNRLKTVLGNISASTLYNWAWGNDDSKVDPNRYEDVQSISNSNTFMYDVYDVRELKQMLKVLVNTVSDRLEKEKMQAYTVSLQIKYGNFTSISRNKTVSIPVTETGEIYEIVEELFIENYDETKAVRLLGVGLAKLAPRIEKEIKQISFLDNLEEIESETQIDNLVKDVEEKFGKGIIKKGYYRKDNVRKDWNL